MIENLEDIAVNLNIIPEDQHKKQPVMNIAYDPNERPPNFQLAYDHLAANRVYKRLDDTDKIGKVCPCCNHPIQNEQLSICSTTFDIYHLGSSIALYFRFILIGMATIFMILAVMGIYGLITNFMQDDCDPTKWQSGGEYYSKSNTYPENCNWSYITTWSLASKRYNEIYKQIQSWLMLGSCILLIIIFQRYRKSSRTAIAECDITTITPADYSLKASNFPLDATKEEIMEWFVDKAKSMPAEPGRTTPGPAIEKVNIAFNIAEYVQFQKEKTNLLNKKFNTQDPKLIEELENKIKVIEENIVKEESKAEDQEFTGTVFVTLNYPENRDNFLSFYKFGTIQRIFIHLGLSRLLNDKCEFKGHKIILEPAPEPSDILWENLNYTLGTKIKTRAITTFATVFLLAICFFILVSITYAQVQLRQSPNKDSTQRFLSFLASFLVLFINTVLAISIRKLSAYEKYTTQTNYYLSVAQKLCFSLFINTAITSLLAHLAVEIFNPSTAAEAGSNSEAQDNFWGQGGLAEDIWYIFLSNAFATPIITIFDPWWILRKYKQLSLPKQGDKCTLTQSQVHSWFQGQNYDIAYQYAAVMKTIWLSAFYASMLPMGMIVSLVGLFLYYWLQKYILLRRCAAPSIMGSNLQTRMTSFLEFTPFIYALGSFIFNKIAGRYSSDNNQNTLANLIALAITAFYVIFPSNFFAHLCWADTGEDSSQIPYSEARLKFSIDYGTANPITHKKEFIEWLETQADAQHDKDLKNKFYSMLNEAKNQPEISLGQYLDNRLKLPSTQVKGFFSIVGAGLVMPNITGQQNGASPVKIGEPQPNGVANGSEHKYLLMSALLQGQDLQNSNQSFAGNKPKTIADNIPDMLAYDLQNQGNMNDPHGMQNEANLPSPKDPYALNAPTNDSHDPLHSNDQQNLRDQYDPHNLHDVQDLHNVQTEERPNAPNEVISIRAFPGVKDKKILVDLAKSSAKTLGIPFNFNNKPSTVQQTSNPTAHVDDIHITFNSFPDQNYQPQPMINIQNPNYGVGQDQGFYPQISNQGQGYYSQISNQGQGYYSQISNQDQGQGYYSQISNQGIFPMNQLPPGMIQNNQPFVQQPIIQQQSQDFNRIMNYSQQPMMMMNPMINQGMVANMQASYIPMMHEDQNQQYSQPMFMQMSYQGNQN